MLDYLCEAVGQMQAKVGRRTQRLNRCLQQQFVPVTSLFHSSVFYSNAFCSSLFYSSVFYSSVFIHLHLTCFVKTKVEQMFATTICSRHMLTSLFQSSLTCFACTENFSIRETTLFDPFIPKSIGVTWMNSIWNHRCHNIALT